MPLCRWFICLKLTLTPTPPKLGFKTTQVSPPLRKTYGLDVSAMLVSGILNLAGIILTLLGSVFLVLTLAAKIIAQSKTKVQSGN